MTLQVSLKNKKRDHSLKRVAFLTKESQMKKYFMLFFSLLLFISFGSQSFVNAQESSSSEKPGNYTVTPNFGISQKKETSNFYDMKLAPKASDNFELTLNNESNQPQTFQIEINNATTNLNGIVDYTQSKFKKDPSMKLDLKDLIKNDSPQLTVGGHQSHTVRFHLTMPDQAFNGILLGGIVVRPVQEKKEGKGIQNVFIHTIALRIAENDTPVHSELIGGDVKIGQENLHNQVSMAIRNPQAKLMSQLNGDFIITKKGETKPLVNIQKQNLSIAPNSAFELPVSLNDHFKPGTYTYKIVLKNDHEDWQFSKDFTIKESEANMYNQTSVDYTKKTDLNWIHYMLVGITLFLLLILFYFLGKRSK